MNEKIPLRRFVLRALKAYAQAISDPDTVEPIPVACGSCRACCRVFDVAVTRADLEREPTLQITGEWRRTSLGQEVTRLRHAEDGTCVHLTERGCGIYEGRPAICRSFDCRTYGVFRLASTTTDEKRHANFEAFNVAAFHRTRADIAPPSTKAEERAYTLALANRRPEEDTGSGAIRGILAMGLLLKADGDKRAADLVDIVAKAEERYAEEVLR